MYPFDRRHNLPSQSLPRGISPRFSSLHAPDLQTILYLHASRQSNSLLFPSWKRSRCVTFRLSPPPPFCRKRERSVPVAWSGGFCLRGVKEACLLCEQHALAGSVRGVSHTFKKCGRGACICLRSVKEASGRRRTIRTFCELTMLYEPRNSSVLIVIIVKKNTCLNRCFCRC